MLVAVFLAALALANENEDAYHARTSVWDQYDNNMDGQITLDDLRIMNDYTHIWSETLQSDDDELHHEELQEHKNNFKNLWQSITATFHGLDKEQNEVIDMADYKAIEKELELAGKAMKYFENEFFNAGIMLGQDPSNITISFTQLDSLRSDSESKFDTRIDAAFHRLGGNEDTPVKASALASYTDDIALLWSVMETVIAQNKEAELLGNPKDFEYSVPKEAYHSKQVDLGVYSADKVADVQKGHSHLVVGQKDCLENGLCESTEEAALEG